MKTIYNEFGLGGNIIALGGNLWNERMPAALRRKRDGDTELSMAARVVFDEILPELQNFMEQKIAHELRKHNSQVKCTKCDNTPCCCDLIDDSNEKTKQ